VFAINTEMASSNRARANVESFVGAGGFKVPVLLDNGSVAKAYGVSAVPKMVFIDPNGVIHSMHIGGLSMGEITSEIDQILED